VCMCDFVRPFVLNKKRGTFHARGARVLRGGRDTAGAHGSRAATRGMKSPPSTAQAPRARQTAPRPPASSPRLLGHSSPGDPSPPPAMGGVGKEQTPNRRPRQGQTHCPRGNVLCLVAASRLCGHSNRHARRITHERHLRSKIR
jgi:hypothetical protein